MDKLKKVLHSIGPQKKLRVVDTCRNLLATPINESSLEAAIIRYGNCDVLHDKSLDGIRVIRIDTSKRLVI